MKAHVTVNRRNTIPASLRRKFGIKDGTRVVVDDNRGSMILKPMTGVYLQKLQGSLKGKAGLNMHIHERGMDERVKSIYGY